MIDFVVRGIYVNFYFDNSKVFAFADAHCEWVHEYTVDVSLFYGNKLLLLLSTSALNITAPNTINFDNIELFLCN